MPTPHADQLVLKARDGTRLSTSERRHAVAWMMSHDGSESNVGMAEIFQVNERTIRDDKKYIREEYAKFVKNDDISLVIADIALNFDRQIRDLESGKRALEKQAKGNTTRTYIEFCRTIFNMEIQKINALQALGYYPRNLGTLTTQKFEFVATVGMLDESGRPVPTKIEAGRASDDALDVEFSDVVQTRLLEPGKETLNANRVQTPPDVQYPEE